MEKLLYDKDHLIRKKGESQNRQTNRQSQEGARECLLRELGELGHPAHMGKEHVCSAKRAEERSESHGLAGLNMILQGTRNHYDF